MAVEAGGIGARLRAGREKMGLTVLQVAERIHTDPKIVEAVEAENFEVLAAPVYARGHIRHYAELVGESVSELIALYSGSGKVEQPDITRIVKAPAASDSSKLVAPALVVIGVFAVAGAIWWVSALSKKKPQMSETHLVGEEPSPLESSGQGDSSRAPGQSSSQSNPVDGARTSGQAAVQPRSEISGAGAGAQGRSGTAGGPGRAGSAGAAGAAGTGAQARAGSAGAAGAGVGAQDRSGSAGATSGTGGAGAKGRSGTPPSASAAADRLARGNAAGSAGAAGTSSAEAEPARPKNQAQVTLRYSSDSWTEVYDANGTRLFYDVGAANSVQTLVGTPPLRVVLGNVAGVAVQFNGHNVPITNLALTDGSAQFSINRSGRVIRAKPVADGG